VFHSDKQSTFVRECHSFCFFTKQKALTSQQNIGKIVSHFTYIYKLTN